MTAKTERDQSIDRVARKKWMDDTVELFEALDLGKEFTGEDIRLSLIGQGAAPPHHHNAWGALIMRLAKEKKIHGTDRYQNMKSPKSHARRTRVYTKCRPSNASSGRTTTNCALF